MSATAQSREPATLSAPATKAIVLREGADVDAVLTAEALAFITELQDTFGARLHGLLLDRARRQATYDAGAKPDFLDATATVRNSDWTAAPVPDALQDRRVEITGPVDRKMIINALNSGARVFMADFEDASAPTFGNMIQGQINLRDQAHGRLDWTDPKTGKAYRVGEQQALLIVRPRGLHMIERHVLVGGAPIAASFFDFGLHVFHNGRTLAASGKGPFYYLPKIEHHEEAKLWNDIFVHAQDRLGIPQGTIKATVLIETLPAAFQMDEIIWALREHIAGLNCGRWDYIFSYIKTLRAHRDHMLPDREQVTMDRAFLSAYSQRLVQVCHRRGIHAMGGMAAQIPIKNDHEANAAAFAKVRADKLREVTAGHDGTWVAHPDLVPVAMEVFDAEMPLAHQIRKPRQSPRVSREAMLAPHAGAVTERGLRTNISVAIEYIAAWLCGRGAVPIRNLMEDAATAEIARAQVWQWIHHKAEVQLEDGGTRVMDRAWFRSLLQEEILGIIDRIGVAGFHRGHYASAARIFEETAGAKDLPEFLTGPAYDLLCALD
ncbi:malate synthase A [Zavarzinia sp. CC-PAN008]|uniref:malate synthase A n=1 Tax=Zavarzinia sp. CC-PAN008 TaxID=3243332 RepID=UPI003F745A41